MAAGSAAATSRSTCAAYWKLPGYKTAMARSALQVTAQVCSEARAVTNATTPTQGLNGMTCLRIQRGGFDKPNQQHGLPR